jgi:hypothetical protein
MSAINFGSDMSLSDFAHAVKTVGRHLTIIGEGEMGMGKSAMLNEIVSTITPYNGKPYIGAMIDCTLLVPEDMALPYMEMLPDGSTKITRFAPNARFGFHTDNPVAVCLDEIGKASRSVQNVLLTLLYEKRIGDHYLPEGSIVFATTNLSVEGLGDTMQKHAVNRACKVRIRKPDADTWIENYAIRKGLNPAVIAWVKQFPHCLASVTDASQAENPYINNLRNAAQGACVTGRSLEHASHIADVRDQLGENATLTLLAGTIGESAARDMQAFFTVADKLPTWDAIIANPETAKLPDDAVAKCILTFSAVTRVDKDTLGKWMKYVQRMDREWQALFAKSVMKNAAKQSFCVMHKDFTAWATANSWLF